MNRKHATADQSIHRIQNRGVWICNKTLESISFGNLLEFQLNPMIVLHLFPLCAEEAFTSRSHRQVFHNRSIHVPCLPLLIAFLNHMRYIIFSLAANWKANAIPSGVEQGKTDLKFWAEVLWNMPNLLPRGGKRSKIFTILSFFRGTTMENFNLKAVERPRGPQKQPLIPIDLEE